MNRNDRNILELILGENAPNSNQKTISLDLKDLQKIMDQARATATVTYRGMPWETLLAEMAAENMRSICKGEQPNRAMISVYNMVLNWLRDNEIDPR